MLSGEISSIHERMNTRHEYLAVDLILYTDEVLFPKVIAAVSANFETPNVISRCHCRFINVLYMPDDFGLREIHNSDRGDG